MADERDEIPLPPAFLKFQAQIKTDRKTLLRDKAYAQSPEQLRAFIAQFIYPRLDEFMQLMGGALYDTYSLAVSSENQIQRMRAVYGKALDKLGADVGDENGDLPGVSPEILDEFQQSFYAIGTLLQKKLSDDKEMEEAYNKCAGLMSEIVAELLGEDEGEGEEDEEEEGGEGDDEEEEGGEDAEEEASEAKADEAPAKPKEDADV